jgi:hypothetical protein
MSAAATTLTSPPSPPQTHKNKLTWRSMPSWHRLTASASPGRAPRARGSRGPPGQEEVEAAPSPPSAGWAGKNVARKPYERSAPPSFSGAGEPAAHAGSWRTAVQAWTVPSAPTPPGRPGPHGGASASAHAPGGPEQVARGGVGEGEAADGVLGKVTDQEAPGVPGMVVRTWAAEPPSSHSVCVCFLVVRGRGC